MTAIRWLTLLLLGATTFAQETGITVNAVMSRDKVAVILDLPAPWHANANPASSPDFIPTTLTFAPNPNATFGKISYPTGQTVTVPWSDTPVSLYSGKTIIFADVTITADTTLTGTLKYQACDDRWYVAYYHQRHE